MPIQGPNGQEWDSFEACVTDIQDEDTSRSEAQQICGSFEKVDKDVDNGSKIEFLTKLTKELFGDFGQDDVNEDEVYKGASLSGLIDQAIKTESSVKTSESNIVERIAKQADTTKESVMNAREGSTSCPSQKIINAVSKETPIDKKALVLAGRADGCDYSLRKDFEDESEVIQKNDEQQIVTGIVLRADATDLEGDFFPASTVEKMSYGFMKDFQQVGLGHEVAVDDAHIVESYLAKTDYELNGQEINKGDWIMSVKVQNDEMWKEVKEGNIAGFSIGGRAEKVPVSEETE